MDRRTFLKTAGMGSVAFAAGCNSHPERHLYTFVHAPEDMVTGEPTWYATTCRECPAGCGVLVANREDRAVKLEGNPLHPINQGKLCARGQAALQGLYNPDRLRDPLIRQKNGGRGAGFVPIGLAEAMTLLQQRLAGAASRGKQRVAMLSEVTGDNLLSLAGALLSQYGSGPPLKFEPFAFESLKFAHREVFRQAVLPSYRLDQADLVIGFGADFIEAWLSPVEYTRKFKAMHALSDGVKGLFVEVGPVQGLTGVNADRWMACSSGGRAVVLMGLVGRALAAGRGRGLPGRLLSALARAASEYTPEAVSARSGLGRGDFDALAARLLAARKPLILGSATADAPAAPAVDLAAVLLNAVLDPQLSLLDFNRRHRVEIADPRAAVVDLFRRVGDGQVDVLLLNQVNPVYALPPAQRAAELIARDNLFAVAFTDFMDETAAAADLIIPTQMPLERWDLYESGPALTSTLQPTVGQLGRKAPHLGDLLLQLLPAAARPAPDYNSHLIQQAGARLNVGDRTGWLQLVQRGGSFESAQADLRPDMAADAGTVSKLVKLVEKAAAADGAGGALRLQTTASLRFYDGRGASRPWLPEIPDPVVEIAWQSLLLVHPKEMARNGWADGQVVRLTTPDGRLELPAVACDGLAPGSVAAALGQGHASGSRYSASQGVNPVRLLSAAVDADSGGPLYSAEVSALEGLGRSEPLASVSGSADQHGRKIALTVMLTDARKPPQAWSGGLGMKEFPLTLPLPEGYNAGRDFYPPHQHAGYRWGMVVDMDRCTGCSACVAACYAENNVGVVGQQHIVEGREMSWIRIERYRDQHDPGRVVFLPMMCQHCDNGPCESVCPVFAPHHSKEGINNQIYNRCIGTRFCAQNCPYKVRRFNWFDWQWPYPLNLQLNPTVTVRSKGVMEKCSFCVQRIKAAHDTAKNENRAIRDGEVQPACVQTCPTGALRFGNLMDPGSAVRRLIQDPRAYQVMGYLNTKPAVIYLRKVVQPV